IVGRRIEGYSSGDHRSRQADEDGQHCYSHPWRIALLERFWQARHPPRYAAYLIPSSPSFPLSSRRGRHDGVGVVPDSSAADRRWTSSREPSFYAPHLPI